MLSEHDFLTPEECSRISNLIHGLKEHWVNRSGGFLPFYTLGAVSYLDTSKESQDDYLRSAERLNPILKAHFPLLYERLLETLSAILNMPVSYADGLSLPGFHIFLANKAFEHPIASTHFDLQFKSLNWTQYEHVDFDHPISFTAAIALPSTGAGLNYWEISHEEVKELSKAELEKVKETKEKLYFPYQLGKLILHQGLLLHQIAPSNKIKPEDQRITLQGHGLLCDGIMRIYW